MPGAPPPPQKNSFYGNFQFVHVNPPWSARKMLCEFVTRQTCFYARWGRKIDKNEVWQSAIETDTDAYEVNMTSLLSEKKKQKNKFQICVEPCSDVIFTPNFHSADIWLALFLLHHLVSGSLASDRRISATNCSSPHLLWRQWLEMCINSNLVFENLTLICETFENLNTHDHQNQMPFLFIYMKNHLFISGQTFNLF